MTTVITYGSYDLLHYGHIRLLERAKALGDYLIVGVTSDDYDRTRGKANSQQSLMERIEGVRALEIADKIIVEEYDGQKIDDIKHYDVDIFTVGSDWEGKFDYLKEYCQVVYLPRTEGISSTDLRSKSRHLKLGLVGRGSVVEKIWNESGKVNGLEISSILTKDKMLLARAEENGVRSTVKYEDLIDQSDAVFIRTHPQEHPLLVKKALERGVHVLVEPPMALDIQSTCELQELAKSKNLVLMSSIKTAYSIAYHRLVLLAKSGFIGKVVSVDATCTSLFKERTGQDMPDSSEWGAFCAWGPTALLPVFDILGDKYTKCNIAAAFWDEDKQQDSFSKIDLVYPNAVATIKLGKAVKSEGELVVSGTKGYIYVPAPWWKTDYFEVRRENPNDNRRFFYNLEGEGLQNELVNFLQIINNRYLTPKINYEFSIMISKIKEKFKNINIVNF